ncbi:MAG: class I SAM-dependent RNA methyltransferase [Lentisphaeria bacterium]|nr:class I SAM-dependent RNA methyltransferase [Lentisphaeria bacterium]
MNSEAEVLIHGFAFGGRAVGRRPDGKVCFVRGAVPGETVRVKITAEKKNYSEGILDAILAPSEKRLVPGCPNQCPGCSYAHIPYEMELEWKQRQFCTFAEKARLRSRPADFLREPEGAPVRTGWRNKIRLSLEFASDRTVRAGYRDEDNKTLVQVSDCLLAVPEIREVLRRQDWRKTLKGTERNLTFRWTRKNGIRVFSSRAGTEPVTDEISGFGSFQTGESSFFQINPYMSGKLAMEVLRLAEMIAPKLLVELYCGCGCFSIICAEKLNALRTFGIELDADAARYAKLNAELHGVADRAAFAAGDSATVFRKRYPDGLPPETLVLVDPPRTGLDPTALELLCRSKAAGIIYVSCSPDTLFRDLAKIETKYRIEESRLLDMFPSTAHFESVTLLRNSLA